MDARQALSKLRIHAVVYALLSFLAIGGLFALLTNIQSEPYALQWVIQATVIMLLQTVSLWRILPSNHHLEETHLLARFGPGNVMTLIRGSLIALLGGFLLLESLPGVWAWLPAVLYLIADLTDFLDGYLARITDTVTQMGSTLDMNNDALGVLLATALAFQFGTVPWWYLPFGLARYAFLLGLYLRKRKGLPEYPLKPNNTRRLFAGIQMGFISVMLFPVVGPPATTFAATLFLIPFLGMFVVDYWQVTGEYDRFAFWKKWCKNYLGKIIKDWLPLAMRILAVSIFSAQILRFGGVLNPKPGTASTDLPQYILWLDLLFMILLALGAINRVAAIVALVITGIQLQQLAFNLEFGLLLTSLIYILLAGSGKFSLWKPEEWLITNRPGQKQSP